MTIRLSSILPCLVITWLLAVSLAPVCNAARSDDPVDTIQTITAVAELTERHPPEEAFIRSRALTVTSLVLSATIAVASVFTVGWLLQGDGSEAWLARLPVALVAVATGVAVFLLLLHHGDRRHGVNWQTNTVHVAPLDRAPRRLQLSVGRCMRSQTALPPASSTAEAQWIWHRGQTQARLHDGGSLHIKAFDPIRLFSVSTPTAVPTTPASVELGMDGIPVVKNLRAPIGWQFRDAAVLFRQGAGYKTIHGGPTIQLKRDWIVRQLFDDPPRAVLVAVLEGAHSELKRDRFAAHTLCQELPVEKDLPPRRQILFQEADFLRPADPAVARQRVPRDGIAVTADAPAIVFLETPAYLAKRPDERVLDAHLQLGVSWLQTAPGIMITEEVTLEVDMQDAQTENWHTVARVYHRPVDDMNREALIAEAQAWERFQANPQHLLRKLDAKAVRPGQKEIMLRLRCEGGGAVATVTKPRVNVRLERTAEVEKPIGKDDGEDRR